MEFPKENPHRDDSSLAAESQVGADDASGLPVRLTRYSKAHHRAVEMAHYASGRNEVKVAQKLEQCGSYLLFRDYHQTGKVRLHAADFCKKHLLCPLCAIRRGAKMLKSYLHRLSVVLAENPELKPYLVTLTVKNGDDLRERFQHLHGSIQRLHKMRHRGRNAELGQASKAAGAVWSYEFKRGANSGGWHPHVHAVWLCKEAPDAAELSREWHKITGDSFIVDARPFHDDEDILGGFLEVFKYAVKFSDLPLADNWHGFEVLSKKRLIASFGAFRGIPEPDDLADDDSHLDDEPFLELMYRFAQGVGYTLDTEFRSLAVERQARAGASAGEQRAHAGGNERSGFGVRRTQQNERSEANPTEAQAGARFAAFCEMGIPEGGGFAHTAEPFQPQRGDPPPFC